MPKVPLMEYSSDIEMGFIVEHYVDVNEYDHNKFMEIMESVLTSEILSNTMSLSTDIYLKYIDRAISNMSQVTDIDTKQLVNFYQNIYTAVNNNNTVDISIQVYPSTGISKIRPEYLLSYVNKIKLTIGKITANPEDTTMIVDGFTNNTELVSLKKQLAKIDNAADYLSDNLIMSKPDVINISGAYMLNKIIPDIKTLVSDVNDLKKNTLATENYIRVSISEFNDIMITYQKMKERGDIRADIKTFRKIDQFLYNCSRNLMTLVAFVTHLTIRRMNMISFNMVSYYNLYNSLLSYYPEGDRILNESTVDAVLEELDDEEIYRSVRNNLGIIVDKTRQVTDNAKHQISKIIQNSLNVNVHDNIESYLSIYKYDMVAYNTSKNIFSRMIYAIEYFISKIKSGRTFDEALADAGLRGGIYDKANRKYLRIDDLPFYHSLRFDKDGEHDDSQVAMALLAELINYEDNVAGVCKEAIRCREVLNNLIDEYSNSINSMYDPDNKEVAEFLINFKNQYKLIVVGISRKLISRLLNISDLIDEMYSTNAVIDNITINNSSINSDIMIEMCDSIISELRDDSERLFSELTMEYKSLRSYMETGVQILYEADESVQDKLTATAKIKKFIDGVLAKFNEKVNELFTKNGDWLKKSKKALQNLDTTNVTIKILPYGSFDTNQISQHINQANSKINSLQPNELYKKTQATLRKDLFPSIPTSIRGAEDKGFSAVIKTFYSVGNNKPEAVSYSGDRAKVEINKMITYCENYSKLASSIDKQLKTLATTTDNKITQMMTAKNINESVNSFLFEEGNAPSVEVNTSNKQPESGNTTGDKSNTNKSSSGKKSTVSANKQIGYLSSDVRMFSTAILTAIEARNIAYMSVLRSLISKTNESE